MRNVFLIILGLAVVFAVVACEDDTDEVATSSSTVTDTSTDTTTDTTTTTTVSTSVTFTGTLSAPAIPALMAGLSFEFAGALDPTQYELFCVTFTNPPLSGSGTFDASGNFSVTVEGAAGLPVGCFIVEILTGASVATLTFEVGAASEFDDGTSSATALEAGDYQIDITFDPEAGTATADITAIAASTVEVAPTFDVATIPGTWGLTCAAENTADVLANCQQFMGTDPDAPFSIYLDIIRATIGTETLHAMGIWAYQGIFVAAGSTEGIDPASLPAGVTVESLNSDVVGASATGSFSGMTSDINFNPASHATTPHTMSGNDLVSYLANTAGIPYDPAFDDSFGGSCASAPLVLTIDQDRGCLLEFYEQLGYQAEDGTLTEPALSEVLLMPRLDGASWDTFAFPRDEFGIPIPGTGDALIQFESTQIADTPEIRGRFALMDLELNGDTGIARQFETFSYTDFDEATQTEIQCTFSFELSIIFAVADADNMSGRFTIAESSSCDGYSQHDAFLVNFGRLP